MRNGLGLRMGAILTVYTDRRNNGHRSTEACPGPRGGEPMSPHEALKLRRNDVLRIAASRGARRVRVFGSTVRGEQGPASDIDLLVEMEPGRSLIDLMCLEQDLEELLGTAVDIVTEAALSPRVRERVLAEAVAL